MPGSGESGRHTGELMLMITVLAVLAAICLPAGDSLGWDPWVSLGVSVLLTVAVMMLPQALSFFVERQRRREEQDPWS